MNVLKKTNKIYLNASQIAIITGENKWKKFQEYILELWSKYNNKNYNEAIKYFEDNYDVEFKEKETDEECIKRICKDNNLSIKEEFNKCLNSKNVTDLQKVKNEIMKKIEKKITKEEKKDIKKAMNTVSYTKFGTDNEKEGSRDV